MAIKNRRKATPIREIEGDSAESGAVATMEPPPAEALASPAPPAEFRMIPITDIVESKTNPRKVFSGGNELCESVRAKGILQPLVVRPIGAIKICYELVCGARRLRAAKGAGLAEVPCIIRHYTDREVLEIQIIENDQRADVNPMEQAEGYERLLKYDGYDVAQIAAKTGRSDSYVRQRLQLTRLREPFREMVMEGQLALGHGLLISRLSEAGQKELASSWNWRDRKRADWAPPTTHSLSVEIANLTRNLRTAAFPKDSAALVKGSIPCIHCSHRSGFDRMLFADIDAKADLCHDAACYDRKQSAFVQIRLKAFAERGEDVTKIHEGYIQYEEQKKCKAEGIVSSTNIRELTAKEAKALPAKHVKNGIIVNGERAGHMIMFADPKLSRRGETISPAEAEQRARNNAERKKALALNAAADAALGRIKPAIAETMAADPASARTIHTLLRRFWEDASYETQRTIGERRGWTAGKTQYGGVDWTPPLEDAIAKDEVSVDLLCEIAVFELHGRDHSKGPGCLSTELIETAKRFGIDAAAILKEEKAAARKSRPMKVAKVEDDEPDYDAGRDDVEDDETM